jgi:hypothetical protein
MAFIVHLLYTWFFVVFTYKKANDVPSSAARTEEASDPQVSAIK